MRRRGHGIPVCHLVRVVDATEDTRSVGSEHREGLHVLVHILEVKLASHRDRQVGGVCRGTSGQSRGIPGSSAPSRWACGSRGLDPGEHPAVAIPPLGGGRRGGLHPVPLRRGKPGQRHCTRGAPAGTGPAHGMNRRDSRCARMRPRDSSRVCWLLSTTTSGCSGSSPGSATPVKCAISPRSA